MATPDEEFEVAFQQDASQAEQEETESYAGKVRSILRGLRYYSGHADMGEYIYLLREPNNPYDKNAIRADDIRGYQLGCAPN